MKITALAGGTGAAKLLRGLARDASTRAISPSSSTPATTRRSGGCTSRRISTPSATRWPASSTSARAGASPTRPSTPSTRSRASASRTWFNLGDRDLATHLHRTRLLREGRTLTEVTRVDRRGPRRRGDRAADVRPAGAHAHPRPRRLARPSRSTSCARRRRSRCARWTTRGAERRARRPACWRRSRDRGRRPRLPLQSDHLDRARSSPSRASSRRCGPRAAAVVAVSPIVGGAAVSGPAGRLMAAPALPVSAAGVARAYGAWLDVPGLRRARPGPGRRRSGPPGVAPVPAPTMMSSREAEVALARHVLAATEAAR